MKLNGGGNHMGEQSKQLIDGYDGKNYFKHGNVRIIIKEHFSEEGKSFENIIEESIIRHAKYDNRQSDTSPDGGD